MAVRCAEALAVWGFRFVDIDGILALRQVCCAYVHAVRHATARMRWTRWEAVMFDAAGDVADELDASVVFYQEIPSNQRLRLAVVCRYNVVNHTTISQKR